MSHLSHAHVHSKTASLQPLLDAAFLKFRTSSLNFLVKQYEQCKSGRCQIAILEGPEGIGKTYLTQRFLHFIQQDVTQTATIFYSKATVAEQPIPYHPLLDMLQKWTTHAAIKDKLATLPHAEELLRLIPTLAERYPELSPSANDSGEQTRAHLAQAIAAAGSTIARTTPLVICLDDMQWADDSTLALLSVVVSYWQQSSTRVLLLLCLQSDLVKTRPTLLSWYISMQEADLPTSHFTLAPFTTQDVTDAVHTLATPQTALTDTQLDTIGLWLSTLTGGHPLYLLEVLRQLLAHHLIEIQQQSIQFQNLIRKSGRWLEVIPPGLNALIHARLTMLTHPATTLLTAVATAGHSLTFVQLLTLTGLSTQDGQEALNELVKEQFICSGTNATYYFTHNSIGRIIYTRMNSQQKLCWHQRIAAFLQQEKAASALIVRHAMAGQLYEQAFQAAMAAGDEAVRLSALQEANAYYSQAEQALHHLAQQVSSTTSIEHLYRQFARISQ